MMMVFQILMLLGTVISLIGAFATVGSKEWSRCILTAIATSTLFLISVFIK